MVSNGTISLNDFISDDEFPCTSSIKEYISSDDSYNHENREEIPDSNHVQKQPSEKINDEIATLTQCFSKQQLNESGVTTSNYDLFIPRRHVSNQVLNSDCRFTAPAACAVEQLEVSNATSSNYDVFVRHQNVGTRFHKQNKNYMIHAGFSAEKSNNSVQISSNRHNFSTRQHDQRAQDQTSASGHVLLLNNCVEGKSKHNVFVSRERALHRIYCKDGHYTVPTHPYEDESNESRITMSNYDLFVPRRQAQNWVHRQQASFNQKSLLPAPRNNQKIHEKEIEVEPQFIESSNDADISNSDSSFRGHNQKRPDDNSKLESFSFNNGNRQSFECSLSEQADGNTLVSQSSHTILSENITISFHTPQSPSACVSSSLEKSSALRQESCDLFINSNLITSDLEEGEIRSETNIPDSFRYGLTVIPTPGETTFAQPLITSTPLSFANRIQHQESLSEQYNEEILRTQFHEDLDYLRSIKRLQVTNRNRDYVARRCFRIFNRNLFKEIPNDIKLVWNRRFCSTAGQWNRCHLSISLSTKLLDYGEKLRDTVLHEMCHAAVNLIDEEEGGRSHSGAFRQWNSRAYDTFPMCVVTPRCPNYAPLYDWLYTCLRCGKSHTRTRVNQFDDERCPCGGCYRILRRKQETITQFFARPPSAATIALSNDN